MQREALVRTLLGFAGAGVVLAIILWVVDAQAVFRAILQANPPLVALVAGLLFLWIAAWGIALWHVLAALDVDTPLYLPVLVYAAAAFANRVTPFGQAGGEPVTALVLSRATDIEYEVGFASITSLDAINVIPSMLIIISGMGFLLLAGVNLAGINPLVGLVVAIGLLLLLGLAVRYRWWLRARIGSLLGPIARPLVRRLPWLTVDWLEGLSERVTQFVMSIEQVATDRRRLAVAIGFSALGWVLQAVALWVTFLSLDVHIPLLLAVFVIPISKFGGLLATPGGLGGTQAIGIGVITLLTDVGAATVTAAVTIYGIGGYILVTTVGGAVAAGLLGIGR